MPDVNGTRHHLMLGWPDWAQSYPLTGEPPDWEYDRDRDVARLKSLPFTFPQPAGDRLLTPEDRRGSARDRYGHWYWIGPDRMTIRVRWTGAGGEAHYWSAADVADCPPEPETPGGFAPESVPAPPAAEPLAGLAVTTAHYLVVGLTESGAILVFDLHTGGTPQRFELPLIDGELTQPWDMAPLPDGGVVILDRVHGALWILDSTFRPVPLPDPLAPVDLLFQPEDAAEPPRARAASDAPLPLRLTGSTDPVSVEPLEDASFLILDLAAADVSTVHRYAPGTDGPLASVTLEDGDEYRIPAHDFAYLRSRRVTADCTTTDIPPVLFVTHRGGNQAYAFAITYDDDETPLALDIIYRFYPLRSHTGKALVAPLFADEDDHYVYYDQGGRWLPVVELPRFRYSTSGVIDLPQMDGREPGCTWHRLCLDACIPPETAVSVAVWSADSESDLAWLVENAQPDPQPAPYLRGGGPEIPYYNLWSDDDRSQARTGTWELLFQGVTGRFMRIRLTLTGSGRATPSVRALRAHYPRFSYLKQYLPGVYQDDPSSARFVEQFLANPEGLLTTLEGAIAAVRVYLDVRTVPEESVEWLAGWIGLALHPAWSEYQRRLILAHAPYFYQRRGTPLGLLQAIRLVIDSDAGALIFRDSSAHAEGIQILEEFRRRGRPDADGSIITDASALAHRFSVLLTSRLGADQVELLREIIELEKPAHTAFTIRQYWAMFRVGEARLGYDTTLDEGLGFELLRLAENALAESYLGTAYPYYLTDRTVITGEGGRFVPDSSRGGAFGAS
jgi:phage tail-like protein